MIELERDETQDFPGEVWHDANYSHVIVQETPETVRYASNGPGWYVRDEDGETGPWPTLDAALLVAGERWGEVTLAPANRLARDIADGRADKIGHFLLEYLADYGAVGIDAQALAQLVLTRIGVDEEA